MKANLDLVWRDPASQTLRLRGWALPEYISEKTNIVIEADEPVEHTEIIREPRADVCSSAPGTGTLNPGFIISVRLRSLKGKVRIHFRTPIEEKTVTLDLDKKYCSESESGSPLLIAKRVYQKVRPLMNREQLPVLIRKIKNNLPGFSPDYQDWIDANEGLGNIDRIRQKIDRFEYRPLVSLAAFVQKGDADAALRLYESAVSQEYPNWQMILSVSSEASDSTNRLLDGIAGQDSRVKIASSGSPIKTDALNEAIHSADGEFVVFPEVNAVLSDNALYEVVSSLNEDRDLDLIYSDEDQINGYGKRANPHFKSDYAPDSLISGNYIGRPVFYKKEILDTVGGFRQEFAEAGSYDLVLRAVEQTDRIAHIPKVLYHASEHPEESGTDVKCFAASLEAVKEALERRGTPGTVTSGPVPGVISVEYEVVGKPKVSVIVPTRDSRHVVETSVRSVCDRTEYDNYEVIIADNGSVDPETLRIFEELKSEYPDKVKVVKIDIPFNYSRINNLAVDHTDGDYLLFLNDDTEVLSGKWMQSMLGFAQHEKTGPVGAKLLYPDDTVQHAGVVLGIGGIAGHIHYHYPQDDPGYFNQLASATNYSCVTAACLMVAKDKFNEVGGFDENIAIAYNDVDLCCALTDAGYYGVYDPAALLYHYESKTRGLDTTRAKMNRMYSEIRKVRGKWADLIDDDPMYNPNLSLGHADFRIKTDE